MPTAFTLQTQIALALLSGLSIGFALGLVGGGAGTPDGGGGAAAGRLGGGGGHVYTQHTERRAD